jgi:hypothetical protein
VRLSSTPSPHVTPTLGERRSLTGVYLELVLADGRGRLVGASNMTDDYDQSDDPWFEAVDKGNGGGVQSCLAFGDRCVHIREVAPDTSTKSTGMELSVQLLAENGTLEGVLKALVAPHELAGWLDSVGFGREVVVDLVDDSGEPILMGRRWPLAKCLVPNEAAGLPRECDGWAAEYVNLNQRTLLGRLGWHTVVREPVSASMEPIVARIWFTSLAALAGVGVVVSLWLCVLAWRSSEAKSLGGERHAAPVQETP